MENYVGKGGGIRLRRGGARHVMKKYLLIEGGVKYSGPASLRLEAGLLSLLSIETKNLVRRRSHYKKTKKFPLS
jgi:hypothetical protein